MDIKNQIKEKQNLIAQTQKELEYLLEVSRIFKIGDKVKPISINGSKKDLAFSSAYRYMKMNSYAFLYVVEYNSSPDIVLISSTKTGYNNGNSFLMNVNDLAEFKDQEFKLPREYKGGEWVYYSLNEKEYVLKLSKKDTSFCHLAVCLDDNKAVYLENEKHYSDNHAMRLAANKEVKKALLLITKFKGFKEYTSFIPLNDDINKRSQVYKEGPHYVNLALSKDINVHDRHRIYGNSISIIYDGEKFAEIHEPIIICGEELEYLEDDSVKIHTSFFHKTDIINLYNFLSTYNSIVKSIRVGCTGQYSVNKNDLLKIIEGFPVNNKDND